MTIKTPLSEKSDSFRVALEEFEAAKELWRACGCKNCVARLEREGETTEVKSPEWLERF
jgi:hypothetical protein